MDKLRPTIDAIKKYHFWVICGALVLTVLICWWMATGGLAAQFQKQKSQIESAFSGLQGIRSGHPNQPLIDEVERRNTELKKNVFEAWEILYNEQKEKNPFPTEVLGEDFKRQFESLRPQEELARRYRERYQNFIKKYFPKLMQRIDVRRPVEPAEGAGGAAVGGNVAGMPGGLQGRGATAAELTGVVEWNDADYARLVARFEWQQTPSTLAVLLAQEDLWVYEALLRVIKTTNEGATTPSNATVKQINAMEIGRDAVAAWKSAENALGLQSAGKGKLDGMMGGMQGRTSAGQAQKGEVSGDQLLVAFRYIDDKGEPLGYQSQYPYANHPYAEFKMMPIRLSLVVDQRRIPRLLANCANSNMPIEVQRVRILKSLGPANAAQSSRGGGMPPGAGGMTPGMGMEMGEMGMGGMPPGMGGMPPGMGMSEMGMGGMLPGGWTSTVDTEGSPFDVPVEIHAIINIYNPPDREKLGTGSAAGAK